MNRSDDLFDADQPADELETALRQMLARRSDDITEAATMRPGTDDPVPLIPRLANRATDVPGGLPGTLLAAAVVALLVLGSVLGVRGLSHHRSPAATLPSPSAPTVSSPAPSPSPTGSSSTPAPGCPLPANWTAALATGAIAVDQPQNYPVSAGPDGSFLMLQSATGPGPGGETDFTHQELAIFDRSGHGTTIWMAADPAHDMVDVSPDSATSSHWVVYGLTASQNLAAHGVVAWNRTTGQTSTVRLLSQSELGANTVIDFDPIVVGDTAYWIEQKFNDPNHQTLVSQPLPTGQRGSQQVSRVSRLVAVGSGVGLLHDQNPLVPGHTLGLATTLTVGPGLQLPAKVAGSVGVWFSSDGDTLRWLDSVNAPSAVFSWKPGQSAASKATIRDGSPGSQLVGPFLALAGDAGSVLDTRDDVVLRLPAGLQFALVTGGDLITATGSTKFGATAIHRVALSDLPPIHC
jgi:hypothetical protein